MGKYSKNFIGNYMKSCVTHNPDALFFAYGDLRYTWAQMNAEVNRLAQALLKLGLQKGDKVTFMFHNSPEFLITNYAIQKAGAIPVPMNYRFTAREIEYQANHSDSTVFLFEDLWEEAVLQARPELKGIKHFIYKGKETPRGMLDFDAVMSAERPDEPEVETGPDDVAVMVYTGGTTGYPKGVMLTYGAHLKMYEFLFIQLIQRFAEEEMSSELEVRLKSALPITGLGAGLFLYRNRLTKSLLKRPGMERRVHQLFEKVLSDPDLLKRNYKNMVSWMTPSMPYFHDASYQLLLLAAFSGNLTLISPPGVKFQPEQILATIEREKPKFMANVPTGWNMLVDYPDINRFDLSSVVVCASGAGVCPTSLKKKMLTHFKGALVLDLFGQTEMTPVTTFRIDIDPEKIKDRSVGQPILEAKIVDEDGNKVAPGVIGEIVYRTETSMKGYYKDEDKTSEVIKDGWFYGGDLGYYDEEGEIRIVERKKECITSGGEKIFPQEVEEVIEDHPKVKSVCVIGVPDEVWGTAVRAVVQLKEGEKLEPAELIRFAKEKLAGYKCPKSVVFTDSFPISPVGKILRQKVREIYGNP
jgi:acyl-CoA synthetase (AMP-forming)/AMP-acid ligase II